MNENIAACRQPGKIYIGIPSGSIYQHTVQLLIDAGLLTEHPGRTYEVHSTNPDVYFRVLDRIDMGRRVIQGVVDAGITGGDYLAETGTLDGVDVLDEFAYSKQTRGRSRLVLASRPDVCTTVEQCKGGTIATEMPNLTRRILHDQFGFSDDDLRSIEQTHGKTETSVPFGCARAFTDITETGATLRANGMVELATLYESSPTLVANREALRKSRIMRAIEEVATRFRAALAHEVFPRTLLAMNVPAAWVSKILAILPSAKAADVVPTTQRGWVAITTLVPQDGIQALMYKLLVAGADDIVDAATGLTMNQEMRKHNGRKQVHRG